ncbi:MAG: tetratricopeptide repeat protein, partial [Candidatus Eremiobacterota bacterium]
GVQSMRTAHHERLEGLLVEGNRLLAQGDAEGARARFRQALKLRPEEARQGLEAVDAADLRPLLHKGRAAMAEGRWLQAKFYYQQVLEADPDNPVAARGLSNARRLLGTSE